MPRFVRRNRFSMRLHRLSDLKSQPELRLVLEGGDKVASVPVDLKYSKTHEWVRTADGVATIGITDHAQAELGDITYLDLPQPGRVLEADAQFGEVESV